MIRYRVTRTAQPTYDAGTPPLCEAVAEGDPGEQPRVLSFYAPGEPGDLWDVAMRRVEE